MTWLQHRLWAGVAMKKAEPTAGRRLWRLLSWAKTGTKAKVEDSMATERRGGGSLS